MRSKHLAFLRHVAAAAVLASAAAVVLASTGASAAQESPDSVGSPKTVTSSSSLEGVEATDGSITFDAGNVEIVVGQESGDELTAEQLALLAPSISCGLDVQWVHGSHHVDGTINGVAVISCTGNAGSLTLHYSLMRVSPNNTQWGAGSKSNTGKRSLQNNRAVPCSEGPGHFQGWAQGVITPPPGYQLVGPPTYSKYGDSKSILCGATPLRSALDSGPDASESISVMFVRSDLAD